MISDAHEGLKAAAQRRRRNMAALSRALHAQRPGLRAQDAETVVAAAIRQAFVQ